MEVQSKSTNSNVGIPRGSWSEPVSCFLYLILTCLVLGSFLPLPDIRITPCPSFSNNSSFLSFSGSAGWERGIWPSRIEGRAGNYLPINCLEIITCTKIIGFLVWLTVWSLPQGPPGTSGYPGSMGPPGLPVSYSRRLIITVALTTNLQL